jgi:8-oxo-dGTP diphosphatase
MARAPILAAGGIVLRQEETPLIAVVRLRKRNEWVLPKGKLDDGETPRDAAEREVLEETGHDVSVQEFLGTLVYESGGRSKVVHYWRMEASDEQAHDLMDDVKAVDWLPLEDAVERLSRGYERAFLANVGPLALRSAELAEDARRRVIAEKRRSRRLVAARSPIQISDSPQPDLEAPLIAQDEPPYAASEAAAADMPTHPEEAGMAMPFVEESAAVCDPAAQYNKTDKMIQGGWRAGMVRKVRGWLRREKPDRSREVASG